MMSDEEFADHIALMNRFHDDQASGIVPNSLRKLAITERDNGKFLYSRMQKRVLRKRADKIEKNYLDREKGK